MFVPPMSQLTLSPMEFVYEGAEYIFGEPFFFSSSPLHTPMQGDIFIFFPKLLLPLISSDCARVRARVCVWRRFVRIPTHVVMDFSRDSRATPGRGRAR